MIFGKRRKKEFSEKEIEQIINDYNETMKSLLREYLPRWARRAMNKAKGRSGLTVSKENEEIQEIKRVGISAWLDQTTQDMVEELSSLVSEPVSFRHKLDAMVKEFKKKWNIK